MMSKPSFSWYTIANTIITNILTLYFALQNAWGIETVLFIYLVQTVYVYIFTILKLCFNQNPDVRTLKIQKKPIKDLVEAKIYLIPWFTIGFGLFTTITALMFLDYFYPDTPVKDILFIKNLIPTLLLFLASHVLEFIIPYMLLGGKKTAYFHSLYANPFARIVIYVLFCFVMIQFNLDKTISTQHILIAFTIIRLALDIVWDYLEYGDYKKAGVVT